MNTNYSALAATSMEVSISRSWTSVWTSAHPVLRILHGQGARFNRGFNKRGKYVVVPIISADQDNPVDGVSDANQFNAMTLNTDDKLTQAQYNIAHYRGNYTLPATDALDNNELGNRMEARKKNLIESFKNALSGDIASATVDSREKVMGLRFALSQSNTVGNIDQSTYANWRAGLLTGAGPFDISLIDVRMNEVTDKGREDVDLLLAYSGSSNSIYQAIKDVIAPNLRYENPDFVKFGVKNTVYNGAAVVADNRGTSGEVLGLATATWFAAMDQKPMFGEPQFVDKTDGKYVPVTAFACLALNDPGCNFRIAGLTA